MASPGVSENNRFRMTAIIMKLAPDVARHTLEALMRTSEYEKTFIEEIRDQGIAKGEAKALLRVLAARGLDLTDEQREQIAGSGDPAQLDRWLDRAITAATADEVFGV